MGNVLKRKCTSTQLSPAPTTHSMMSIFLISDIQKMMFPMGEINIGKKNVDHTSYIFSKNNINDSICER